MALKNGRMWDNYMLTISPLIILLCFISLRIKIPDVWHILDSKITAQKLLKTQIWCISLIKKSIGSHELQFCTDTIWYIRTWQKKLYNIWMSFELYDYWSLDIVDILIHIIYYIILILSSSHTITTITSSISTSTLFFNMFHISTPYIFYHRLRCIYSTQLMMPNPSWYQFFLVVICLYFMFVT